MTIKTKLLVIVLVFGLLPVLTMIVAGNQIALGSNREFHNTMAIALMVTILTGLISPGMIKKWFFANQIKKMQDFCQQVKIGQYDVVLTVPNNHNNYGEDNELVDLMRDMNWMVHRIKVNEAELRQAVDDLERSRAEIQSQKMELEEVNAEQLRVQCQLEGRTQELNEAVGKLRSLLDNAGQGFLSFSEDLKVAGEYSAECVMIFNQEVQEQYIPALLYPDDAGQREFMADLFERIFREKDAFRRENYLSLLPDEVELAGSYIQLTYKLIRQADDKTHDEILLILTDVTQKREMEEKIQQERDVLSLVVKAVSHQKEFTKAKADYEDFCRRELPTLLLAPMPDRERINKIFRAIHTWKGIFAQLGLQRVAEKLHELEFHLTDLRKKAQASSEMLITCLAAYQPETLYAWLEQELEQLRTVLGDQFFLQNEIIPVESCKLCQLEEKIRQLLAPCQAGPLIEDLRRLRYRPFPDMLDMLPEYIGDLALNQEKEIGVLSITGAKPLVDPEKYHDFTKALVHVFRNAVAHGLETPDERLTAGKAVQGRLTCHVEEQGANLAIMITDDGRGMDANQIKQVAIDKRIGEAAAIRALPEKEAVNLIFADGFSSMDAASELAGRGVGLAAVKQEVEKLDGHIEVRTAVGQGTTFTFVLPLVDSSGYRTSIKEAEQANGACASCG